MYIDSKTAEENAVLNTAYALCAAAKTAPKGHGADVVTTAILTGGDKDKLAAEMRRMGEEFKSGIFTRDSGNVDRAAAVVLIGVSDERRGLGKLCQLCHYEDFAACAAADGVCVFSGVDLGVAVGSAVALAADLRIDNRIMFTIGKAAAALKLLGDTRIIMGIPLSVSAKSPFFDRK